MLVYFFRLSKLTRPFNEYSQLERMLALRKLKWSYLELAQEFKVPKLTIRYLVRRFGLVGKYKPSIPGPRTTSKRVTVGYPSENINLGKTYAEYLQEAKERQWRIKQTMSSRQS